METFFFSKKLKTNEKKLHHYFSGSNKNVRNGDFLGSDGNQKHMNYILTPTYIKSDSLRTFMQMLQTGSCVCCILHCRLCIQQCLTVVSYVLTSRSFALPPPVNAISSSRLPPHVSEACYTLLQMRLACIRTLLLCGWTKTTMRFCPEVRHYVYMP